MFISDAKKERDFEFFSRSYSFVWRKESQIHAAHILKIVQHVSCMTMLATTKSERTERRLMRLNVLFIILRILITAESKSV